jgi:hypothetical protein
LKKKQPGASASQATTITQKRVFGKKLDLLHDLYKLKVANALRYIGFDEKGHLINPIQDGQFNHMDWTQIEHCHFFHTIDQRGQAQRTCTTINGHFHDVELVSEATDDSPAVYRCSGPKKVVMDRVNGRMVKRIINVPFDDHTHDVSYLRSEVLQPRKLSSDALAAASKFIETNTLRQPDPVEGIQG